MKIHRFMASLTLFIDIVFITQHHLIKETNAYNFQSLEYPENKTEHEAMLAIKRELMDHPTGVLSSWNHSLHHCFWYGVRCGPRDRRVTELRIQERGLTGTLSPFIGNLSNLLHIDLNDNNLHGRIPAEIGRLFRLQRLNLYNNRLTGRIPANVSGCINLDTLEVGKNKLEGKLPMGLGALSHLTQLDVQSNNFIGPPFDVVANLTSLEVIICSDNAFVGTVPDSISRMRNLYTLALMGNRLSGMIPSSIFNLSSLHILELSDNNLGGSIPQDIAFQLPQLQILNLVNSNLSGPFPMSIQNLTTLEEIHLSNNSFIGSVPPDFGHLHDLQWLDIYLNNLVGDIKFISTLVNCSKLQSLDLRNNYFEGILPKVVANLSTSLSWLATGQNPISGEIAPGIGDSLPNLAFLDMSASGLTGSIPNYLGKLQKLENLFLNENRLKGIIPDSFGNLTRLSRIFLNDNELQGSIPPTLGSCANLLFMEISNNNFSGSLPNNLFGGSAKFIELDLSFNYLEGSLPMEISKQINMIGFYVFNNLLSGEIPNVFDNLEALEKLYMEDNFFCGSIPPSFSSLTSLVAINLSNNNLSGLIPEYFSTFPLTYLNLSFNNFEGKVPTKGIFANTSAMSLVGNNRLCGGIPELHLPRCVKEERSERKKFDVVKLAITISCALVVVLMTIATIIWLYLTRHKKKRSTTMTREMFLKVSYDMLLKATDGFSTRNLLGSGAFGSVFKGILDNGNTVAVKVLNLQKQGSTESFMAECEALRNVRHRNLVGMITVCSSIDFQMNDFRALIYEFMPNGSLDRWLHQGGKLNLLQRLDIAVDIAQALNYLHHECENPIVHCDLKPSNILLDNDMVAHVGDFGLAKVLSLPLQPNQSCSSTLVRGTVGYAAPEYGLGGEASPEADIYSYGIMMLELMTRKRPIESMFKEDLSLHMYAKMALPDQILQIVDSALTQNDDEEAGSMGQSAQTEFQKRKECMMLVVKIGVACSNHSPHDRMKISTVSSELQKTRNILLNPRYRNY